MLAALPRLRVVSASVLTALVALPSAALAFRQSATFETRVHGHAFSRVSVETRACDVRVQLQFDAPEAGYKHEAAERNIYRFHARVKLDKGRTLETPIFQSSAPGARSYSYTKDTSAEGCWAKEERSLRGFDVEGCRGGGCKPEPFKS